jgi:hypothetical protein
VQPVDIDRARFAAPPSTAAPSPAPLLPGRVALVMAPEVQATQTVGDRVRGGMPTRLQWPVGGLVEAALLGAFTERFADGALRQPAPPETGFAATVRVTEVMLRDDESLRYLIPVPLPGLLLISGYDTSLQLSFALQMLDARGEVLWTRRYDSGRVMWQPRQIRGETPAEGLVRLAHETAWQLSRQAAQDVAEWVGNERQKPRQL